MKKISITTLDGWNSELTIDYGAFMKKREIYIGIVENELHQRNKINAVTEIPNNGTVKHYLRDFYVRGEKSIIRTDPRVLDKMEKYNAYGSICGHRTDTIGKSVYVVMVLSETEYKRILTAIEEDRMENTTEEAQDYIDNKARDRIMARLNEAKDVIEKAKHTIRKSDGSLMTYDEAVKWRKQYNDINNESGEGFVPEIITVENLRDAENFIKENEIQDSNVNKNL